MEEVDKIGLGEFVKWVENSKEQAEKSKEEIVNKMTKGRRFDRTERDELITEMYERIKRIRELDSILGGIEEYKNNGGAVKSR